MNHMPQATRIGFIGLGVMGEPMCSNLARKAGLPVPVSSTHLKLPTNRAV